MQPTRQKRGIVSKLARTGYREGGVIRGPGSGTSDSIPREMRTGSFILPADSTQQLGSQRVPVRVSNGETEFTPEDVHAIGAAVLTAVRDSTHRPSKRGAVSAFADGGTVDVSRDPASGTVSFTGGNVTGTPSYTGDSFTPSGAGVSVVSAAQSSAIGPSANTSPASMPSAPITPATAPATLPGASPAPLGPSAAAGPTLYEQDLNRRNLETTASSIVGSPARAAAQSALNPQAAAAAAPVAPPVAPAPVTSPAVAAKPPMATSQWEKDLSRRNVETTASSIVPSTARSAAQSALRPLGPSSATAPQRSFASGGIVEGDDRRWPGALAGGGEAPPVRANLRPVSAAAQVPAAQVAAAQPANDPTSIMQRAGQTYREITAMQNAGGNQPASLMPDRQEERNAKFDEQTLRDQATRVGGHGAVSLLAAADTMLKTRTSAVESAARDTAALERQREHETGENTRAATRESGETARAQAHVAAQAPALVAQQERLRMEQQRLGLDQRRATREDRSATLDQQHKERVAALEQAVESGTPEERQKAAQTLAAYRGKEVPGVGKAMPASAAGGLLTNMQNLRRAQNAFALMSGKTVDGVAGDGKATGMLKGILPNTALNLIDPQGVDTRAAIADLGSLVVHDRSGAAVTAAEFPRLAPFIPGTTDDPVTARKKLAGFIRNYQALLDDQVGFYTESGYKVPSQVLKQGGADDARTPAAPSTLQPAAAVPRAAAGAPQEPPAVAELRRRAAADPAVAQRLKAMGY